MKTTKIYLDGEIISRKDIRGRYINDEIKRLQNVCLPKDMSISKTYDLSNGQKLKIFVSSK